MRFTRLTLLAVVASLAVAGCSSGSKNPAAPPPPPTPPTNDSPANAVLLFKWGWEHRDTARQDSVLTDNFKFIPGTPGDTAATVFPNGVDRPTMLAIDQRLFVTGAGALLPHATSIALGLDNSLRVLDNARGLDVTVHKDVLTGVSLVVKTNITLPIGGTGSQATFYVVRGDSTTIHGAAGLATRWYVEGVFDDTGGTGAIASRVAPAAITGAHALTWADLLAMYR